MLLMSVRSRSAEVTDIAEVYASKRVRKAVAKETKRLITKKEAELQKPRRSTPAPQVDQDWFVQRMADCGLIQKDLAVALDVDPSVMGRILSGKRKLQSGDITRLAEALKVPVGEILLRMGGIERPGAMEFVGRVLADGRVSPVVDHSAQPAILNASYPIGVAALYVEAVAGTGAMAPWSGAAILFMQSGADPIASGAVGKLCVLEDLAQPMPFLGVLNQAAGGRTLEAVVFATGEQLAVRKLVRASLVFSIQMPLNV